MEQSLKDLARELLIERIKAYMYSNPRQIPGPHVVKDWYIDCLTLAQEIAKETA